MQCRLRPITSLISPLYARKYQAIRENSQGKWLIVLLPSTTLTACLSIGFSNSCSATSFSLPSFSFQLWGLAMKSIKETLLKGILSVAANTTSFFLAFLEVFFFQNHP